MTVEAPSPVPLPAKLSKKQPAQRMYLPAVYRYSCQGAFSASSLERGSTGNCKGIRSKMEHLLDMNPSTRTQAISSFTGGDGVDTGDEIGLIEDNRPNPALIYPRMPFPLNQSHKKVTDEEEDTKVLRETWTAFGSTEVECLQLTDLKSGHTEIVAVSPYNAAIVSSRKIEMRDRSVSSTEFGIGPYKMQFLIESGVVRDDLEEDFRFEKQDQKEKNEKKPTHPSIDPAEQQENSITPINMDSVDKLYASSSVFLGKMVTFSGKVVDKMQSNAQWLYGNLSDDFASRTVASGKRIIHQMPKTATLLTKVIKQVFGQDDGRDGDDR